jgi:hypothetical protein
MLTINAFNPRTNVRHQNRGYTKFKVSQKTKALPSLGSSPENHLGQANTSKNCLKISLLNRYFKVKAFSLIIDIQNKDEI